VEWNLSEGAEGYTLYRSEMPRWTECPPRTACNSIIDELDDVYDTYYDDFSVIPGKNYYYWVTSFKFYYNRGTYGKYRGNWSKFDTGYAGASSPPPAAPIQVSASDGTVDGEVTITWSASADSLIYEIYRANMPVFLGGNLIRINWFFNENTDNDCTFVDDTVVKGKRYYYWVKARNSWGVSRYSVFDTGYIGTAAPLLPAPTGVSASDGTVSGKVTITWNAVSGPVVYEVWRATKLVSEGGEPQRIGFLSGTSFDDTLGTSGTTYYYWAKSRNSWGASKYSIPDTGYRN